SSRLGQQVEIAVVRKNQVRLVAHENAAADVDAVVRQLVDFRKERLGIDHHAVADYARDAGMQDPRRYQPQHELRALHVDGVAGVVTALIAANDGKTWREEIDDLALAFVAPLGTQDNQIHQSLVLSREYGVVSRQSSH